MTEKPDGRGEWLGGQNETSADRVEPVCPADDPVAFAAGMGFTPDERQAEVLRAMADPSIKQGILNCTRQWGKSTTSAAGAVQRLVTRPGSLVVGASPSKKQSAELVRTVVQMLGRRKVQTRRDGVHEVSAVLPNGSRIVGLPGNEATSRGLASVSLLLIDEAARVPDAICHAVRPMVVIARGDVWLMSTPWSAYGFFYEAWEHGGPDWARFAVKATECERIPAEWLEKERAQLSGWVFRREYMTEFVQDDLSAFDAEVVEEAMDEHVAPMEIDWAASLKERGKWK